MLLLCPEQCQCFFNIFLVATAHWFSDRSDNWLLSHNWTFLEQNIKYCKAGFLKTIHHTSKSFHNKTKVN